jgi:hypothetical protein
MEARVWPHDTSCCFFGGGGESGGGTLEQVFLKTNLAFFCGHHSTDIPYSFICHPRWVVNWPFRGLISSRHSLIQPQTKARKWSRLKAVTAVLLKILLEYDAVSVGKHLTNFQKMHNCSPIDTKEHSRRHIFSSSSVRPTSLVVKISIMLHKGKLSYPIFYSGCAEKIWKKDFVLRCRMTRKYNAEI